MPPRTDSFDLGGLRLTSGEGRKLDLAVGLGDLEMSGERYAATPAVVPVHLDISRTTGEGYALRLRFTAGVEGPCMRCLEPANPSFEVDAREISQPGEEAEEFESPYLVGGVLDLAGWAHDALVLVLPATLLCRPDCAGLCPICGESLNQADADHHHEPEPDPRWAKLSEIRFDPPAAG